MAPRANNLLSDIIPYSLCRFQSYYFLHNLKFERRKTKYPFWGLFSGVSVELMGICKLGNHMAKFFYYMCVFLEKRTFGFSKGSQKTKKKVTNQCPEPRQGLAKAAVASVRQTAVGWCVTAGLCRRWSGFLRWAPRPENRCSQVPTPSPCERQHLSNVPVVRFSRGVSMLRCKELMIYTFNFDQQESFFWSKFYDS